MIDQADALRIQAELNKSLTTPPSTAAEPAAQPDPKAWKPERYVPPHLQKYVESDKRDAAQIQRWKRGDDMTGATKWLAPGIPTSWYAHQLAKEHGISYRSHQVFESEFDEGIFYACVWTFNPNNLRVQIGAAYWEDKEIAKFFAYRNSVRQQLTGLCLELGKSEKRTWQAKDRQAYKNAVKYHA